MKKNKVKKCMKQKKQINMLIKIMNEFKNSNQANIEICE